MELLVCTAVSEPEGTEAERRGRVRLTRMEHSLEVSVTQSHVGGEKRHIGTPLPLRVYRVFLRPLLGRIADHPINRIDDLLPWNLTAEHAPQSTVRLRSCHDQCAYSMAPGSGAYCHVLATQHPVETARARESASLDSLRFHVATTIWQDLLFELYCYTKPRSWQKLIREL